jgi:hypothetical protein
VGECDGVASAVPVPIGTAAMRMPPTGVG